MSAFDPSTQTIKVFEYIEALDAFLPTKEFEAITKRLGIFEWSPVVWIGRLLTMDNDFGEHWFDNWDEREAIDGRATEHGYNSHDLLVLNPDRFKDGQDGPCHSSEFRKRFWTDVLKSLRLSIDLIFDEARAFQADAAKWADDPDIEQISDLNERIEAIRKDLGAVVP
jgi:hypothetical protein